MNYTLAVTSCGRHDLLRRTLQSFCDCVAQNPFETVILEDGPAEAPAWLAELKPRLGRVRWLNNPERMGQSYSIDRLYSNLSTEYIFWCEDDWEFHESNFLRPSFDILRDHPEISMVALRSDWNHPTVAATFARSESYAGTVFEIAEPYWAGVWGGTCWNPGLRRLSDFKRFGSYGRHVGYGTHGLGHEQQWSKLHLDLGYRIAVLPRHCRHTGGGRSRAIEPVEAKLPKILIAVPACREFNYGRWESEQSPRYNQATAWEGRPYGTDIHISGPNPRIEAVRETWFRDVGAFERHVDARFFFGRDSGEMAADEVSLPVRDDYASLAHKTIAICKWALDHGYDYLAKFDDDSIVYIDRLVREILDNRNMDYGGYCNANIVSGGPGYILSRRAMQAVATFAPDHWAEDVTVGICLERARITPVFLSEHRPGFKAHWYFNEGFDPKKLDENIVSAHAVQPEMMRLWHQYKNSV